MLIILLVIMLICGIVFTILDKKSVNVDFETVKITLWVVLGIAIFISFLLLASDLTDIRSIDEKIQIVSEQNEEIENDIENVVKSYMDYESKTYSELKLETTSDFIAIAQTYPELHSSQLVNEQIKTLNENKENIKKLKTEKAETKARLKIWFFIN